MPIMVKNKLMIKEIEKKIIISLLIIGFPVPSNASFLLSSYEKYLKRKAWTNTTERKVDSLYKIGVQFCENRKYEESIPYIQQYVKYQKENNVVANNMSLMSEPERSLYWNEKKAVYTKYLPLLALTTNSDSIVSDLYDATLLSKGILLNTTTSIKLLLNRIGDEELEKNYNLFLQLKEEQKSLESSQDVSSRIDTISFLIDSVSNILKSNNDIYLFAKLLSIKWTDIRKCLNNEDIAVEFVEIPLPCISEDDLLYAALLLKNTGSPSFVPLFRKSDMVSQIHVPYVDTSFAYDMIWGKLECYLSGIEAIYFSPTGLLHRIPIEYLSDKQGIPVNASRIICRLSSTRELITARPIPKDSMNCVLLGGLDFVNQNKSNNREFDKDTQNAISGRTAVRYRKAIEEELPDLPWSKKEIMSIKAAFDDFGVQCDVVTGETGTERCFRNLSQTRTNIIHIATHGFYKPVVIDQQDTSSIHKTPAEDLIMMQSGFYLSGCNRNDSLSSFSDPDDNIITAAEIAKLDFSQTDLITLSACETALGYIGEDGVYGLQRGFKKAGVQSAIVSLWAVDDKATSIFMRLFYTYYLDCKDKYKSLFLAQEELRSFDGGIYDNFYYWGAFILIDGLDFIRKSIINDISSKSLYKAEKELIESLIKDKGLAKYNLKG